MNSFFLVFLFIVSFSIAGCGVKGEPQPYIEGPERTETPQNQKGKG